MKPFDDYIKSFENSLAEECGISPEDILLAEALLIIQKILDQSKQIKTTISARKVKKTAGKLLLLCAELETINSSLKRTKHEYNL